MISREQTAGGHATAEPDVHITRFAITASDVTLATRYFTDADAGPEHPRPTLILRTPYGAHHHEAEARGWVRRGFNVAIQDVRGRGDSTGDFEPYVHEEDDGAATADFLLGLPECDGRLLAYGGSYAAHCALALCRARKLAGLIALVPSFDRTSSTTEFGGVVPLLSPAWWWFDNVPGDGAGPRGLAPQDFANRFGRDLVDGSPPVVWPEASEPAHSWQLPHRAAEIPILIVSGFDDPFAAEAVRTARRWPGSVQCIAGRWGHTLRRRDGSRVRHIGRTIGEWTAAVLADTIPPRNTIIEAAPGEWRRPATQIVSLALTGRVRWRCDAATPFPSWQCSIPSISGEAARGRRDDQGTIDVPGDGSREIAGIVRIRALSHAREIAPASLTQDFADNHCTAADQATPENPTRIDTFAHLLVQKGGTMRWLATAGARHAPGAVTIEFPMVSERLEEGSRLVVQFTGHDFPVHDLCSETFGAAGASGDPNASGGSRSASHAPMADRFPVSSRVVSDIVVDIQTDWWSRNDESRQGDER